MKRNLVPLLGIAFVVALAASGIFYGVFVGQLRKASQPNAKQQIVVAVRALDRGTVLKTADLKLAPWAGLSPPGAFTKLEDATGKTIYSTLEENEPVTASRLGGERDGGLGIVKGMRALSVHVVDSAGLIPFLKAGNHVDVQVVKARNSIDTNLRTILQNVEVLSVQPLEANTNLAAPATVTLLANPEDADRIALADSGANIRLLLRNPLDSEEGRRPGLMLASLFTDSAISPRQAGPPKLLPVLNTARASAAPAPDEPGIELTVLVGGGSAKGVADILSSIPGAEAGGSMQALALPKDTGGRQFWSSLERRHQIELFSSTHLTAHNLRESGLQTGKTWKAASGACGLYLRFQPRIGPNHTIRLRIQPEISIPAGISGLSVRKLVADLNLEDGQSLIVTGFSEPGRIPTLATRLFGDHAATASNQELLVLVTPRLTPLTNGIAAGGR